MGIDKGIYAIINHDNNKVYIGMTNTSFTLRWKYHVRDLLEGSHSNKELQREFDEYGQDAFSFYILEELEDNVLEREREWIAELSKHYPLYNVIDNPAKKGYARQYYTQEV